MWVQNKPTNVNHFQIALLNSIRSCYRNDTIFNGMDISYCNMTFNLYKNINIYRILLAMSYWKNKNINQNMLGQSHYDKILSVKYETLCALM